MNLGKLIFGVISWADFNQPFTLQAAPILICNSTCQALPISIIHGQTTAFSLSGAGRLVYQAGSRSDMRLCISLFFYKESQFTIRCSVKCLWKNLADSVPPTPLLLSVSSLVLMIKNPPQSSWSVGQGTGQITARSTGCQTRFQVCV